MEKLALKNMPELPFYVEEALNQLRISLSLCGNEVRTIMVTSSLPNEGKSFVTIHLWRMMAQVGLKVLLVDCDLRNSVMRSKYGLSSETKMRSVAEYLAGKAELGEVVYETDIPNAYILPMVSAVSNPAILLENRRFSSMLEQARKEYDYVLVDTPPLGSVADALTVAPLCDGSVLVVRANETPRKLIENSVNLLKRTDTPMLGMVLNRAEAEGGGSYYRKYYRRGYKYYRKYGYGYGYGANGKRYGEDNPYVKKQ